jgi:hypothetical protein
MKKLLFCILKVTEDLGTDPHLLLDPLVPNVMDPEHWAKRTHEIFMS